jgi:hypothetical protein
MATMRVATEMEGFRVVHPLDDLPEQKCSSDGLGQIAMTPSVRLSLKILRGYRHLLPGRVWDSSTARLRPERRLRRLR